jgi:hypothetical protein
VSNSLFLVSTFHARRGCAFNVKAIDPEFPAKRVKTTWRDCPPMWNGAYGTGADGKLVILNKDQPPPADYHFILDGRDRSPYFDFKVRGKTTEFIAREMEADESGSSTQLNLDTVRNLKAAGERMGRLRPTYRGRLKFSIAHFLTDEFTVDFIEDPQGPLRLWCELVDGRAPLGTAYAEGNDISGGTGRSNSVVSLFDRANGKQCGEYVTGFDNPIQLARIASALGWMFAGDEKLAMLNFDVIGSVGSIFRNELKRLGYWHFFRRDSRDETTDKPTEMIGTHFTDGPGEYITDLIDACAAGRAEVRSADCFDEFSQYGWLDGSIVHLKSHDSPEESEGRKTHGDRACAAALAWAAVQAFPYRPPVVQTVKPIDFESPEWLDQYFKDEDAQENADASHWIYDVA